MNDTSTSAWADTQETFRQAARWFVGTAATARPADWDRPGLGEWTVRDLVGHTSRALLTVETYLEQGGSGSTGSTDTAGSVFVSAADYYPLALAAVGDPALVAQRGRDAGLALGPDPAQRVAAIADRVLYLLGTVTGDDIASTPAGRMRLADYLPTRIFELTVHTCDLAASLGAPIRIPDAAASASLHLLGDLAVRRGRAADLLLAATGRGGLPPGFTVL